MIELIHTPIAPELQVRIRGEEGGDATDAGLAASLMRGDDAAFWRLWEGHRRELLEVCLRQMRGNHAEAEDALGQIMLKARERLPLHAARITALRPWLIRMARNLCIDIQRGRRLGLREPKEMEAMLDSRRAEAGGRADSPETALELVETVEEIQREIQALPKELREALLLRCVERIPTQEAAARLGVSADTLRKRIQLARKSLRGRLKDGLEGRRGPSRDSRSESRTAPLAPAVPAGKTGAAEILPHTAFSRTTSVLLDCGIRREFTVFLDRRPMREGLKISTLRAYLKRHPRSWRRRLDLADLLYQTGCWSEAVEFWRSILARRPWRADLAARMGWVLGALGRREAARAALAAGLAAARLPATRRHLAGMMAANNGDWEGAGAAWREAADLDPSNPAHRHQLARALMESGRAPEALRVLEELPEGGEADRVALTLACDALRACGRAEEARLRLARAIQLAPEDALLACRMADLLLAAGCPEGETDLMVKSLLRRAVRRAPDSFPVQESLGQYRVLRGDAGRGLEFFKAFAARHPFCALGWDRLGRLLRLGGMEREALEAAARARALRKTPQAPCNGACAASSGPGQPGCGLV